MAFKQIHQSQVPDGMVANVPWGTPCEQWTDRMIERGLDNVENDPYFPHLQDLLNEQVQRRGIERE